MIDPIVYQSEVALRLDLRPGRKMRWPWGGRGWVQDARPIERPRFRAAR
ncbi:hypothetical protein [Puniceibacterium sediminis]|uniref:Uncharacterized protein n=1 Tax=Puniceibacterium sediminis TaxID=1608407 RepID=A0A238XY00_9RHOB|nr:hypothetical protein [Puniceibacterium sediminis]SNR63458.1 hypothetical protein SAMN06265370_11393 [Puniceibacterium sediminis]